MKNIEENHKFLHQVTTLGIQLRVELGHAEQTQERCAAGARVCGVKHVRGAQVDANLPS